MNVDINQAANEEILLAARHAALEDGGAKVLGRCVQNSPEDSGNLRRNHKLGDVDEQARKVEVVADTDYAFFVHDGWARRGESTEEDPEGPVVASYEGNSWMTRSIDELTAEGG